MDSESYDRKFQKLFSKDTDTALKRLITVQEEIIREKNEEIRKRDKLIEKMEGLLAKSESKTVMQDKIIREKDEMILNKDKTIKANNETILITNKSLYNYVELIEEWQRCAKEVLEDKEKTDRQNYSLEKENEHLRKLVEEITENAM